MQFFKTEQTYNFMSKSAIFLGISIFLIISSIALFFTKGLNYGIDFAGGTVAQIKFQNEAPIDKIREIISKDSLFSGASISEFGSKEEIVIKVPTSAESVGDDMGDKLKAILHGVGEYEIRRVDMVGPKVGGELREKGLLLMFLAILAILVYVSFRFEWRFALASVVALIHDVSITVGVLILFNVDINLDILAAILTLIGYSLNDTIIVFDRIREQIKTANTTSIMDIINESVTKTLSRTTLTSLTTFFVILTLFLFGGEIIYGFSFTLTVGIIIGTYSSIFIASPLLKWLGFDIEAYRKSESEKEKNKIEKDKMRQMYEKGVV